MTALAYIATGPAGTRFAGVKLRIVAQRIQAHPEVEKLKTVVQIPGIPEDPIAESFLTPLELAFWLNDSRREGWVLDAA